MSVKISSPLKWRPGNELLQSDGDSEKSVNSLAPDFLEGIGQLAVVANSTVSEPRFSIVSCLPSILPFRQFGAEVDELFDNLGV